MPSAQDPIVTAPIPGPYLWRTVEELQDAAEALEQAYLSIFIEPPVDRLLGGRDVRLDELLDEAKAELNAVIELLVVEMFGLKEVRA